MEIRDSVPGAESGAASSSRAAAVVILSAVSFVWIGVLATSLYRYRPLPIAPPSSEDSAVSANEPAPANPKTVAEEESELRQLKRRLQSILPRGTYIVVDTARNRLYVKRGDRVLHDAVCSTGSGMILREPSGERVWIFDTPRGVFRVRQKARDPVWVKPDWAFVEEGKPVPQKWSERRDDETLGAYALYFGDGYMIHGTLYQRYLGQSITHGCVRLGDEDLEKVYRMIPIGTPIYIF